MRPRWMLVFLLALSTTVQAQWLNFPTPGTPRTRDGKPNLTAPTPRTADRKPDLSGVWMHAPTPIEEMKKLFGPVVDQEIAVEVPGMEISTVHKYGVSILADFAPGTEPLGPQGAEAWRKRQAAANPANVCAAIPGWPFAGLLSEPIKIVQAARLTLVLYEVGSLHRQVYTDGRVLPAETNFPAFLGYSVGRWDGDVFVVDSGGFNDKTAFDVLGHPHSDKLHITERFRRVDFGHLDVEMTIDDPEMYTKPFTIKIPHTLMADADIFESFCENERDRVHLENAPRQAAPPGAAPAPAPR